MVSSEASKEQKRITLWQKLQVLKNITNSSSVTQEDIMKDAMVYIKNLKEEVEAITKEYEQLVSNVQDVKVEKSGTRFMVKVTCKKKEMLLVSIIEALENIGLMFVQVKTASNHFFYMEALLDEEGDQAVEEKDVTNAILVAIN